MSTTSLQFAIASTDDTDQHTSAQLLGSALLGAGGRLPSARAPWPKQTLQTELLGGQATLEERWLSSSDCREGEQDGLRWRRNDELLYGVIELDEGGFDAAGIPPLQAATEAAYQRIFALLDAQQLPQLWRTWNYMAAINRDSHGLERYRQFNIGRQDAFRAARRALEVQLPAACALGFADGPLSIAFLAGRTPIIPIENPRQMSAFAYPRRYGPRSPSFSRAALAHPAGAEILFISGTASIVDHRSIHDGDVVAQTHETLCNIGTVVDAANRRALSVPFRLDELHYRIYLRHAADLPQVTAVLDEVLGPPANPMSRLYLRADVCRAELLVEVEAQAIHPR